MITPPTPSRWPDLFDEALRIIDQANARGIDMHDWSFGGGTALMLQIGHRDSHDIDIFVSDPQYLPYLNPTIQEYDLDLEPSSYEGDGTRALKIIFDAVGEIDFISCAAVTDAPTENTEVRGRFVAREVPSEILGKKLVFRGSALQPRDMFDIAAAAQVLGEEKVITDLSKFDDAARTALKVVQKMNPDFAAAIMGHLMPCEGFEQLHKHAHGITRQILESAIERAENLV